MFNDFFLGGGRVVKSVSQFVLLQWQPWYKYSNTYAAQQSPRKLRGLPHGYLLLASVYLSAEAQPVWTELGALLPVGAALCLLQVWGGSSAPQDLPPPTACCPEGRLCQRVLFSWWCRNMGDFPRPRVGNWHTIIGQVQSQGTRRDTRPPLSLWKGVDTEKRGDLESLTQSTTESTLDATIWISESSIVWSPSNHPSNTLWALHLGHDSWTLGIL